MTRTPPPDWAVRTAADRAALAAGCYWDRDAAERVIRFAEAYVTPKFTRGEFRLFEWQRRLLMSLYGWRNADGTRRFRRCILHVPKKNGKTLLVSIVALYELLAAGVPDALVVSASTTKANAKQVFDQLKASIRKHRRLKKACRITPSKKQIAHADRDAEYEALSADAPGAEGLNVSCAIVDEAHAHRSAELYQTLEYSQIARPDGLLVVISTAGKDLTHWYYGLVERARRILAGDDLDPATYAEVYEADPERDDLADPATWARCNPSLDQFEGFTSRKFANDLETAKKSTTTWVSFLRYRLNVFRSAEEASWIEVAEWDRRKVAAPPAGLKAAPCFLGFDGSQRYDPTSVAAVWALPGKRYYARVWSWVAEAGAREREQTNLPKYRQFEAEGCLTITPGDVMDKAAVRDHILMMRDEFDVKGLVMDANLSWVFGSELQGDGVPTEAAKQTHQFYHGPLTELEAAVKEGRFTHDGGGWARWCVQSVRLDVNQYEQARPFRKKSADKIDGAVALLMAFAAAHRWAVSEQQKPSVYEKRGVRVL